MLYNQNKIKWHSTDCTIYTMFQIFGLTYWIFFTYSLIEKCVKFALLDKVLFNAGAYFSKIYPWGIKKWNNYLGLNMTCEVCSIGSQYFEKLLNNGYYFWLWLMNGNSKYLESIKDWELNKQEIDKIKKQWGGFGHNHCFWPSIKAKTKYSIFEVYTWTEVWCDIKVLRYAMLQWVYYSNARTIIANDTYTYEVLSILIQARDNPNLDNLWKWLYSNKSEQKAFELLRDHKWKNKFK